MVQRELESFKTTPGIGVAWEEHGKTVRGNPLVDWWREGAGIFSSGLPGSPSAVHPSIPGLVRACIFDGRAIVTKTRSTLDPDSVEIAVFPRVTICPR